MSVKRPFYHDMKNLLGIIIGYSNLMLDEMTEGDPLKLDVEEIRKAGESAVALIEEWRKAEAESSGEKP